MLCLSQTNMHRLVTLQWFWQKIIFTNISQPVVNQSENCKCLVQFWHLWLCGFNSTKETLYENVNRIRSFVCKTKLFYVCSTFKLESSKLFSSKGNNIFYTEKLIKGGIDIFQNDQSCHAYSDLWQIFTNPSSWAHIPSAALRENLIIN